MNLENLNLETFRPGIYRHYKGPLYEADHLIRDANDDTRVGVHYVGLVAEGAKDGPRHMIRTWHDWTAWVHDDGTVCERHDDSRCLDTQSMVTARFRYLGPYFEARMLNE